MSSCVKEIFWNDARNKIVEASVLRGGFGAVLRMHGMIRRR